MNCTKISIILEFNFRIINLLLNINFKVNELLVFL